MHVVVLPTGSCTTVAGGTLRVTSPPGAKVNYFDRAGYPSAVGTSSSIPRWTGVRWQHLRPDPQHANHVHHQPPTCPHGCLPGDARRRHLRRPGDDQGGGAGRLQLGAGRGARVGGRAGAFSGRQAPPRCYSRALIMLFSRALIPTVKEAPADATNASHILLMRGGLHPPGRRRHLRLPAARPPRAAQGRGHRARGDGPRRRAQEILMPALLPGEYFKETGRWDLYGDTLFRLKDRKGGDYHLGPTHEEIVTDIARREIKSWRDLPKNLYQVQVEVPRRAAPARRPAPLPRVPHEGRVLVRRRRGGARKESYEKMRAGVLRAIFDRMGAHVPHGRRRLGCDRRLDQRRVPGARRLGRGRDRRVRHVATTRRTSRWRP